MKPGRSQVTYREPTDADLDHVAAYMRAADVAEVRAASGLPPRAALERSVRSSMKAACACVDGVPAMLFGVCPGVGGLLGDEGIIWALGTDAAGKCARELVGHADEWLAWLGDGFSLIGNQVDARNVRHVAWLRRLGFAFGTPVLSGAEGRMFLPFVREA